MNILTGINSGIIKSPNAVLALALKMQSVLSAEALVYLPPDRVQDLVFAVFSGYRRLQMLFREDPESIRARTIADTERLNNRTLTVTLDEIQNPNVALRVTDFVMKDGQEKVTFLFFLQNDEVISVDLTVTQMEFLLNLLLATIHKTGDAAFISLALQANDFIPFYTVNFANIDSSGINYNKFNVPAWKLSAFSDFYSLVMIGDDGDIPCGAIIKALPGLEASRIKAIGELLLNNNPLLAPYRQRALAFECQKIDPQIREEELEKLLRAHIQHRTTQMSPSTC